MNKKFIKRKILEWLFRYGPAEALATITGYVVALILTHLGLDSLIVAYASSWSDNLIYYTCNFTREFFEVRSYTTNHSNSKLFCKSLKNCVFEFAPAHALNVLLVQPWSIYFVNKFSHDITIGFWGGTALSEIAFYTMVVIAYEFRKYITKNHLPK